MTTEITISEKLRIIMLLGDLTQEKLAAELGVSFPTVNSWLKERSVPHPSRQDQIQTIYDSYAAQQPKGIDALGSKKLIVRTKSKALSNIVRLFGQRKDIYDQCVLELTYNTNRIEGSTLTEPETAAILFNDMAFSNKSLREHLEVKNHQTAFMYLMQQARAKKPIDETFILKLHSILMNGIQHDAGYYRNHGVRIVGSHVPTANHVKIPALMAGLMKDVQKKENDVVAHVAHVHSRFEQIHPFSDGNGRIGRLLLQAMLFRVNYAPALIKQKKKKEYLRTLNESQMKNSFRSFEDFCADAILMGFTLIEKCL